MDKMEEFNKVIDNAIEKLNALREDKPEFKRGELVWCSDDENEWHLGVFTKKYDSSLPYGVISTTDKRNQKGDVQFWKYCKKFDEIKF